MCTTLDRKTLKDGQSYDIIGKFNFVSCSNWTRKVAKIILFVSLCVILLALLMWETNSYRSFLPIPNYEKTLLIGVIVAKESAYMHEWLAHHFHLGVDQIIVYDNNAIDDFEEKLKTKEICEYYSRCKYKPFNQYDDVACILSSEWLCFKGLVQRHEDASKLPWYQRPELRSRRQAMAWKSLFMENWKEFKWIGMIDVDEFLVPNGGCEGQHNTNDQTGSNSNSNSDSNSNSNIDRKTSSGFHNANHDVRTSLPDLFNSLDDVKVDGIGRQIDRIDAVWVGRYSFGPDYHIQKPDEYVRFAYCRRETQITNHKGFARSNHILGFLLYNHNYRTTRLDSFIAATTLNYRGKLGWIDCFSENQYIYKYDDNYTISKHHTNVGHGPCPAVLVDHFMAPENWLVINHYVTKSHEECKERRARPSVNYKVKIERAPAQLAEESYSINECINQKLWNIPPYPKHGPLHAQQLIAKGIEKLEINHAMFVNETRLSFEKIRHESRDEVSTSNFSTKNHTKDRNRNNFYHSSKSKKRKNTMSRLRGFV